MRSVLLGEPASPATRRSLAALTFAAGIVARLSETCFTTRRVVPRSFAANRCLDQAAVAFGIAAVATGMVLLGGCAGPVGKLDRARRAFAAGQPHAAEQALSEIADSSERFGDAAALDLAMVRLASGDHRGAERTLRELRDRFDALPDVAPAHDTAALVSDDTARVFRPAGYEQVMIRSMLAVCSLAGDAADAESYLLQASLRQRELAREAEQRGLLEADEVYQPVALAPYLRGVLREATHGDYDDAERAYRLVGAVEPDFAALPSDLARVRDGTHSAPGHGVVYVLACVGRGPVLRETTAPTTSAALSIASGAVGAAMTRRDRGPALVLPNIASVKIPQVHVPASPVRSVGVDIGGKRHGTTHTLTDVAELATTQLAAEQPWTIARAVVRRAAKETAVAGVRHAVGLDGAAGSLLQFAASSTWSGLEQADTRCWGLLPREIQLCRVELPAGDHTVRLAPIDAAGRSVATAQTQTVSVEDGRNHYVVAIAPGRTLYLVD